MEPLHRGPMEVEVSVEIKEMPLNGSLPVLWNASVIWMEQSPG